MNNMKVNIPELKKALNLPDDAEFLALCSSFTQYTGKKIRIKFLEQPVQANKFIEAIYDYHILHFVNTADMTASLTGFMYADTKEKIHASIMP